MKSYWMQIANEQTVLELRDTPRPIRGRASCWCACARPA